MLLISRKCALTSLNTTGRAKWSTAWSRRSSRGALCCISQKQIRIRIWGIFGIHYCLCIAVPVFCSDLQRLLLSSSCDRKPVLADLKDLELLPNRCVPFCMRGLYAAPKMRLSESNASFFGCICRVELASTTQNATIKDHDRSGDWEQKETSVEERFWDSKTALWSLLRDNHGYFVAYVSLGLLKLLPKRPCILLNHASSRFRSLKLHSASFAIVHKSIRKFRRDSLGSVINLSRALSPV